MSYCWHYSLLGIGILFACSMQVIHASSPTTLTLEKVLLYSVSKTWTNLSASESVNLANNILQGMSQEGISDRDCTSCKKRTDDYLIQRFEDIDESSSNCLHLEKIADGDDDHAPVYALTGDIRCTRPQYDDDCFPTDRQLCSWNQTFELIEDGNSDTFPKYAVNTVCQGCRDAVNEQCLDQQRDCYFSEHKVQYYVLKRTDECDADGYEVWRESNIRHQLTVACSCVKAERV